MPRLGRGYPVWSLRPRIFWSRKLPLTETLVDDFATQDTAKWTFDVAASVVGGQLQLVSNTAATGGILSSAQYDFTGSSISSQVIQYPTTGDSEVNFLLDSAGVNRFITQWWGPDQKLYFGETVNAVDNWSAGLTTTDNWWRIRESAGTVYWDTSADGVTWTNRRNKTWAVPAITAMRPQVWTRSSVGGTAIIDNFNIPGVAAVNTGQFFAMF